MNPPAHFGRLARMYRWMEYVSFGPYLDRCRSLRLREMLAARTALVYGDGDGRFLARLTRMAPQMTVTAVDASATMLRHAAKRLPHGARVTLEHADALAYVPKTRCDLIVSHFFLDCFNQQEVALLLAQVRPAVAAGTVWVLSDFAVPSGRIAGRVGGLVVAALYFAFGLMTGLRTRRLPDHAAPMRAAGWQLQDHQHLLAGLLVSEQWRYAGRPSERQPE